MLRGTAPARRNLNQPLPGRKARKWENSGTFKAKQPTVCTTFLSCRRALKMNENPAHKRQLEFGLRNSLKAGKGCDSYRECVGFGEVAFILFVFLTRMISWLEFLLLLWQVHHWWWRLCSWQKGLGGPNTEVSGTLHRCRLGRTG